jgi:hypothetical protein
MTPPDVVYAHPDHTQYVARFDDEWYRWPAEEDGWRQRVRCPESAADDGEELPPALGHLALRLSGVI